VCFTAEFAISTRFGAFMSTDSCPAISEWRFSVRTALRADYEWCAHAAIAVKAGVLRT